MTARIVPVLPVLRLRSSAMTHELKPVPVSESNRELTVHYSLGINGDRRTEHYSLGISRLGGTFAPPKLTREDWLALQKIYADRALGAMIRDLITKETDLYPHSVEAKFISEEDTSTVVEFEITEPWLQIWAKQVRGDEVYVETSPNIPMI